jgi:hypothetical protein
VAGFGRNQWLESSESAAEAADAAIIATAEELRSTLTELRRALGYDRQG